MRSLTLCVFSVIYVNCTARALPTTQSNFACINCSAIPHDERKFILPFFFFRGRYDWCAADNDTLAFIALKGDDQFPVDFSSFRPAEVCQPKRGPGSFLFFYFWHTSFTCLPAEYEMKNYRSTNEWMVTMRNSEHFIARVTYLLKMNEWKWWRA